METKDSHENDERTKSGRQRLDYGQLSGLGLEFCLSVALVAAAGWWLDGILKIRQSFPACLLLGVFVGLALGIYRMKLRLEEWEKLRKDDLKTK
ncbi:MAG: AtpZ/AtpI family protein [Planctomycetota bacterium]|jgi:F0F1-type ATP synthase assembly protein I|nr:AtpZ/AtpI family protein [Planctomycetota bacterium]MDP6940541.1 AtpZ/AtpI family protein [Planctomycetota bacterium]